MKAKIALLLLISLLVILIAPFTGASGAFTFFDLFSAEEGGREVFYRLRLPRVLLAFFAGASLSLSGLIFQALFRNPLSSPYTLGTSSGAAFGAVLFIKFSPYFSASLFLYKETIGAFFGAFLSTFLVYFIFKKSKSSSSNTMLLAGAATSFFFASLMLFVQYFTSYSESFVILRWLMGGLTTVDYASLYLLAPFLLFSLIYFQSQSKELNLLSLGEEFSMSKGLNSEKFRLKLFLLVSILIALTVSQTGPIGFVGIIVPHIIRILIGPDHKYLIPLSALLGGAFLIFCDSVSRIVFFPAELPVGIITALLGGPFFLVLLIKNEKNLIFD